MATATAGSGLKLPGPEFNFLQTATSKSSVAATFLGSAGQSGNTAARPFGTATFGALQTSATTSERPFFSKPTLSNFKELTSLQKMVQQKIARAIYVTRAPLSLLDHPLWKEALHLLNPTMTPPSSKDLGSVLLDQEYTEIHNKLTRKVKCAKVIHLAIDARSNPQNDSVLTVVLYAPEPSLLKCIQRTSIEQNPEEMCDEISKIIEEFGADNFLGVITGNDANMIDCGRLLNEKYDNILCFGCPALTLRLIIGDIIKIPKISEMFTFIVSVIRTVTKSQFLDAEYKKIANEKSISNSLYLSVPRKKLGSHLYIYHILQRFLKSKLIFQTMVSDTPNLSLFKHKTKLLNESTWDEIERLQNIVKPIIHWIRKLEANDSTVHLVHKAIIEVEDVLSDSNTADLLEEDLKDLVKKFHDRKITILKPVHLAATILDPTSQGAQLTPEENVEGCKLILNMTEDLNTAKLSEELSNYKFRRGIWSKDLVWKIAKTVDPLSWWESLFSKTLLGQIAVKILTIPTTSAAVEIVSGSFSYTPTKKRNEISDKISFISHTWNMTNRCTPEKIIVFPSYIQDADMDKSESDSEDDFSDNDESKS